MSRSKFTQYIALEVEQSHKTITKCINELSAILKQSFSETCDHGQIPDIRVLFTILKGHMDLHFALEEHHQFSEVAASKPWLEADVKQLFDDHKELVSCFSDISKDCSCLHQANEECYQKMVKKFKDFTDSFHQHEQRENEFVMEAHNTDMGTKD